jgi:hypothetical protein
MLLTHETCGKPLEGQVRCSDCGSVLRAHDVQFSLDGKNISPPA